MLVGERMSHPVITISPETPIFDAISLMKAKHIRRLPVVKDDKLVGIVSDRDLLHASPSQATALSVWEINYLLSKVRVSDVMTAKVLTITEDTPIEEAARLMADNKIGGLPVLRKDRLVGMITETDLFKIFLELMGAREKGIRVAAIVADQPGQLAKITEAIAAQAGNFVAFGQFTGESPATKMITFKVAGMTLDQVKKAISPLVEKIVDIRAA